MARESDYRIETIDHSHSAIVTNAPHGHGDGSHTHFVHACREPTNNSGNDGPVSRQLTYPEEYSVDLHVTHPHVMHSIIYEREHRCPAAGYTPEIIRLLGELNKDIDCLREIDREQYNRPANFNNNYGSPWTEMYDLQFHIQQALQYAALYPQLQWIGEKQSFMHLLQLVVHTGMDAKFAIIYYHDWIQRAYDHMFNKDEPSIYWDHFKHGNTIGNVKQPFDENVKIPEEDPNPF